MRILILLLCLYSCQMESSFQDLTPDDDFNSSYYFNSPAFAEALTQIKIVDPDTVFSIAQPEHLLVPPLFTEEKGWMTTDTFAFETGDFQKVLNVIINTAEAHRDSISTALVSSKLTEISLNGKFAYSAPRAYYLVPHSVSNGQKIFIKINRSEPVGKGFLTSSFYTAHGIWMIGRKIKPDEEKDVS